MIAIRTTRTRIRIEIEIQRQCQSLKVGDIPQHICVERDGRSDLPYRFSVLNVPAARAASMPRAVFGLELPPALPLPTLTVPQSC